jgi:hypothetical protein
MPKPKPARELKPYSVLLLYPADIADAFGESYFSHVTAETPWLAIQRAKRDCAKLNEFKPDYVKPADMAAILCIAGHHKDLLERKPGLYYA